MVRSSLTLLLIVALFQITNAQDYRWQQRVEYAIEAKLDVTTHKVTGTEKLVYFNNSKDTLTKVYYHLHWNAFQPGSMMDVRSRNLPDPDGRVRDRISKLTESEIGYQKVISLKQDGKDVAMHVDGTILEVTLKKPLLPNTKTVFDMKFESQVPVQIRRSGRNNREGIAYTMTQWYPKLAEYDFQGWHINQYVAREFHGVWGDFDVKLTLDPKFVVAGTGTLQNAEKIGYGYEKPGTKVERPAGDLTWHFKAKDVIDFAWAADPDYKHDIVQVPDGPAIHLFYQPGEKTNEGWSKLSEQSVKHFQFMNKFYGKYPYNTYSIIQGGDGGMEYPMCTMIIGERPGLAGLMAHEVSHSWFQAVLASNESMYAWFDEGFTDYSSAESEANMTGKPIAEAHRGSYEGYFSLVRSGLQEPMSTLSDHFSTNRAYGTSAYSMGAVYLHQIRYIIGEDNFYKGMQRYFNTWKMRHPEPNDFLRVMEKTSGLQLKWFANYWLYQTKRIDYGVKSAVEEAGATNVTLERIGQLPMPIDLVVTYKDGKKELFYIPLNETFGSKPVEDKTMARTDLNEWYWTSPTYTFKISKPLSEIALIEIDPQMRMADIVKDNNKFDPAAQNLKPADPAQPKN
ncbi:MAG: M1 family metallopeptidase [Cyclobacteriaceae bacterium]|nr:M1 family metallopeptidase [Cyclobacteriaceae bacterium]